MIAVESKFCGMQMDAESERLRQIGEIIKDRVFRRLQAEKRESDGMRCNRAKCTPDCPVFPFFGHLCLKIDVFDDFSN